MLLIPPGFWLAGRPGNRDNSVITGVPPIVTEPS